MAQTIIEKNPLDENIGTDRWMVEIFNNDHNSFEEVVEALMNGTACGHEEAQMEAWEAHHFGKASVHFGSERECQYAANVIKNVGVHTEVSKEWS